MALAAEFRDASEQSRKLLAQARDKTNALQQQLAGISKGLSDSRRLLALAATVAASPFQQAIATGEDVAEPDARLDGRGPTFAAVTELIEQVELSATRDVCLAAQLTEHVTRAIQSKADPLLLIGILLEGIVQTVLQGLPAPERRETAIALCGLMWDRISQDGSAPD